MCSGARTGSLRMRAHSESGRSGRGSVVSVTQTNLASSSRRTVSIMNPKWWTLVAVCTATFMLLVDVTIVNVALPSIEQDLKADFADLQWVIDAYALTLAALLLTAGSLADRIGRKRVFVIGLFVFTIASIGCGLATSPDALNIARAVAGHRRRVHVRHQPRAARLRLPGAATAARRSACGARPPARRSRSARWPAAC